MKFILWRLFLFMWSNTFMRLLVFLLFIALPVHAAILPVKPGESIQAALDNAQPGDTIRLASGVYHERVVLNRSGAHAKPITLEGETGAILDGSENIKLDWQPAPEVAPGAYRAKVPIPVFTFTGDGKIVTMLREDRVKPGATEKDKEGNLWDYTKLFARGVGPSQWEGVKALALYLSGPKELLVRFQNDLDPRTLKTTIAPREPIIHIKNTHRCVVRNLALRNGAYGVLIENSIGSVVENCTIGPTDYGVWLGSGADRCTVRFNEIFMNPYAGADPKTKGAWDNWTAHKRGGHYDRYGVQIRKTRGGHEVHDNYIHDTWDGIEDIGTAGENRGLRIHHNRIFNVSDDGLEPNGAEEDCHWNDNIVQKSICGFRIKAPTHGPLYIYRNIFLDNGEDFRNYGEVELKPAKVYIYHNTCTARAAIQSNKVFGIGTPDYHYFNNLFWCDYWWGDTGASIKPNWKGDYNVYVRRGTNPRWEETKLLAAQQKTDENSLWTQGDPGFADWENRDVSLKPNSPTRQKGANSEQLLGFDWPGLPQENAPDAGALQFGEPMPQLPRKPEQVKAPPAGSWPGPEAEIEREKQNALQPVLLNGNFENSLESWGKADAQFFQIQTENGGRYLSIVTDKRAELMQKITSLVPGQSYVLKFASRGNTVQDARIILRNPADAKYLGTAKPSSDAAWKTQTLKFTAPGPEVTLEISLRSPGKVDLDNFIVEKVK